MEKKIYQKPQANISMIEATSALFAGTPGSKTFGDPNSPETAPSRLYTNE